MVRIKKITYPYIHVSQCSPFKKFRTLVKDCTVKEICTISKVRCWNPMGSESIYVGLREQQEKDEGV